MAERRRGAVGDRTGRQRDVREVCADAPDYGDARRRSRRRRRRNRFRRDRGVGALRHECGVARAAAFGASSEPRPRAEQRGEHRGAKTPRGTRAHGTAWAVNSTPGVRPVPSVMAARTLISCGAAAPSVNKTDATPDASVTERYVESEGSEGSPPFGKYHEM